MTACTLTEHDPVTDVAIVSRREACPHGYTLIDHTVGGLPADLADKKLFGKDHRFFVLTREFPLPIGNLVVQDLQMFHEGSPVAMGYEILSHTRNDGLLSLKKVNFCLKRAHREHVVSCVCDIVFVYHRKKETVPPDYVGIGEVNGLTVAVQFGGIPGALQRPPPLHLSPNVSRRSAAHTSPEASPAARRRSPQTHGEITERTDEWQYSIFRPYFYHGVPPPPDEGIARAEQINKTRIQDDEEVATAPPLPEDMNLFSRYAGRADPSSVPETSVGEDEGENQRKPRRTQSFTSTHTYRSMRPISVVPLTALLNIQFKLNPAMGISSSTSDLLSGSHLDLLYVEHYEDIEEEFGYSFAKEREIVHEHEEPRDPVGSEFIDVQGHSIALPFTEKKPRTPSPQQKRKSKSRLKSRKKEKQLCPDGLR